jgi:predicted amidophosphoribosyltransferase
VKKNWSTAVSVGLRQEPGTTRFIVTGCGSSPVPGVLTAVGVVTIVLFWKYLGNLDVILLSVVLTAAGVGLDWILFGAGRKALESEVVAFVENAGDLWAPGSPSRASPGAVLPSAHVGVQPVFCTSCGAPLAGQARFCQTCGTPVPVPEPERRPSCAACGFVLGENARFCQACGTPVPVPEPERRPSCRACGAPLGDDPRFCHACGTAIPVPEPERLPAASPLLEEGTHCTRCGTLAPPSSLFCHGCGAEVASVKRDNIQTIATAGNPASGAAIRRGYCGVCGQELGVNEKMRGLAVHERCAMPAFEAPASTPATDTAGARGSGATAPTAPDAAVGGPSPTRGYCGVCGQELGVNEKMRGLAVHERCAMPAFEAPASTPATDTAGARGSGATAPTAPDAAVGGPSPTRGYCDVCGRELGVNEKMRGLTVHEKCPMPAFEAPAAAPAQTSQMYCSECGTSIPASSRFCHKCGSAVAAAE